MITGTVESPGVGANLCVRLVCIHAGDHRGNRFACYGSGLISFTEENIQNNICVNQKALHRSALVRDIISSVVILTVAR